MIMSFLVDLNAFINCQNFLHVELPSVFSITELIANMLYKDFLMFDAVFTTLRKLSLESSMQQF